MKRAILLVDHGSRRDEANEHLAGVARAVQQRAPELLVEFAHMELAEPTIAQAIARCVEAGVSEIVVHPFFLGPGRHSREDIPRMVGEIASGHPDLAIRISEPLGLHPGLVDAVLDRVAQER
ncbi:MAG: cobalamin biosynthesis protein CbiX [bacterium]|nr:cobalamin biosynthesis protein CbiX [bacterium]MCP5040532.1 cobalamin biosynthesis protein CbiX [bacterium]